MATFKENQLPSSEAILARQRGKPIIYVEGDSDKKIFENYWFVEHLNKISFATVAESRGCSAVVKKVGEDRMQGLDAYGIVDRDKLMSDDNWALLREVDDNAFEAARPYPEVKVTRRWELESYLLEPEVFERFVSAATGTNRPRAVSEVEIEYLSHANALVPLAALNQAQHKHRIKATGDGYTRLEDRATVDARIRREGILDNETLEADYNSTLPLIDAFSGEIDAPPRTRLEGLLRILNGKAMLSRLCRAANLKDDHTYLLAREIKEANRVPSEIKEFVVGCFA